MAPRGPQGPQVSAPGACSPAHLGRAGYHVLDEVAVAGGIDDGDVVLGGLELPEGDVDGDAALPLCLQLVQHPGILEGAFAHLGREQDGKPQGHPYTQSCPSTRKEVPK